MLSRPQPEFTLRTEPVSPNVTRESKAAFAERLETAIAKTRTALNATQERYKRDFDKRVRNVNTRLRLGDYVYLDPTDGVTKRKKLEPVAIGPFRVLHANERNVYIDRDGLVENVSADRVVYAPPPPNVKTPTPATSHDITNKVHSGPTYVVDSLLDHKRHENDELRFLVKWSGYDETTWEPRSHIPEELISRYFTSKRREHARLLPTTVNT